MKLAKKGIVSVIFALFMQTALAQTPSLPSMKFGEQASLTTPSNAFAYYTSSSTHTEGHGAGRHEELQALARALDYDAERIFNYVRDNIEYYQTFGLGKGALGAEFDKSGTSFDQSHLLFELFEEAAENGASITGIRYRIGELALSGSEASQWFGTNDAETICRRMANGGIPGTVNGLTNCSSVSGSVSAITIAHIWVTATVNGTYRVYDPSFKPTVLRPVYDSQYDSDYSLYQTEAPVKANGQTWYDALSAQCKSDGLLTQAGAAETSSSGGVPFARNFNYAAVETRLLSCSNEVWAWIEQNAPDATIGMLLGDEVIDTSGLTTYTSSGTYSVSVTRSAIPNQYRTKFSITLDMSPVNAVIDETFYADEIYGKRLSIETADFDEIDSSAWSWSVTGVCSDRGGSYNFYAKLKLGDDYIGDGFSADCGPTERGVSSTLSIDMPYAAENGTYLDSSYVRPITLVTRAVIGLSMGDFSADTEAQLTKDLGLDRSTFWVRESGMTCPGECDPPESISYGSRLQENVRFRLFAAWAKQFTYVREMAELVFEDQLSHHYSFGWAAADTMVDWRSESVQQSWYDDPSTFIARNEFSIGSEGIFLSQVSALSNSQIGTNAISHRRTLANLTAVLESSVLQQYLDATAPSGVSPKFKWANLSSRSNQFNYGSHYGSEPQGKFKFYSIPSGTSSNLFQSYLTSDGQQVCDPNNTNLASCHKSNLVSGINSYLANGFNVTAAQDAYLGPGLRCGFSFVAATVNFGGGTGGVPSGVAPLNPESGNSSTIYSGTTASFGGGATGSPIYQCVANTARGGAFIASKVDFSEIAFVTLTPFRSSKGGGASDISPDAFASFEAPDAADAFKASSEIEYQHSVDTRTGRLNYADGNLIAVGSGEFPYSLSFSRQMNSGPIGYDDPIWSHNWNMPLTISGSGTDRVGGSRGLFSAPTLATIALLKELNQIPSSAEHRLQQDVLSALVTSWWADQLTFNTVSASFGNSTEQFVRKPGTQIFYPASGGLARVTQTGDRVEGQPDRLRPGSHPTSTIWKLDNLSFKLETADKQEIDYGFWKSWHLAYGQDVNSVPIGDYGQQEKTGFHATDWSFPTGVNIDIEYEFDNSCTWTGPCSKPMLKSVSNNLGHKLEFDGLAENPTRVFDTTGREVLLTDDRITRVDGSEIAYVMSERVGCAKKSSMGESTSLGQNCIPHRTYIQLDEIWLPGDTVTPFVNFDYDQADRVSAFTDARGESWQYFIAGGRYAETRNPLAQSDYVYYNDEDRMIRSIDRGGRSVEAWFDGIGRLLGERRYDQNGVKFSEISNAYDTIGNLVRETQLATPYDASGLLYGYDRVVQRYAYEDTTWPTKVTHTYQPRYDHVANPQRYASQVFYDGVTGLPELQFSSDDYCTIKGTKWVAAETVSVDRSGQSQTIEINNYTRCLATIFDSYDAYGRPTQMRVSRALNYFNHSNSFYSDQAWLEAELAYYPAGAPHYGALQSHTLGGNGEALRRQTVFAWDTIGNLLSSTDQNQQSSVAEYDAYRRIKEMRDPVGGETHYAYDPRGQLRAISTKLGTNSWAVTQADYFPNGQISTVTDPDGDVTGFAYDALGRLDITTDGVGRQTRQLYTDVGDLKCTIKGYGSTDQIAYASYDYGPDGSVASQRPARGSDPQTCAKLHADGRFDTNYVYDGFRRLFETTFPARPEDLGTTNPRTGLFYAFGDGRTLTRQWLDRSGFPYKSRTRMGDSIRSWNSVTGNVYRRTTPEAEYRFVTYGDGTPTLARFSDRVGTTYPAETRRDTRRHYDSLGQLKNELFHEGHGSSMSGLHSVSDNFSYDAVGNLNQIKYWGGAYAAYTHDALGRMLGASFTRTGSIFHLQTIGSMHYDVGGRLERQIIGQDGLYDASGGPRYGIIYYDFDADGDITKLFPRWRHSFEDRFVGTHYSYDHDASGKMTASYGTMGSFRFTPTEGIRDTYASANELDQYDTVTSTCAPGEACTPKAPLDLAYDGNGNLISDGRGRVFEYNSENQLMRATGTGFDMVYRYDADGRRTHSLDYHNLNPDGTPYEVLHKHFGEMELADYEVRRDAAGVAVDYVALSRVILGQGVDQRLAWQDVPGDELVFPIANHQGSTIALLDEDAEQLPADSGGRFTYDPFGQTVRGGTAGGYPYRYTGRRLDAQTGLYYYRARYYDPELGRFLQTDPIGYEDQMNLYAYVGNDPLGYTDPSGMEKEEYETQDEAISRVSEIVIDNDKFSNANKREKAAKEISQDLDDLTDALRGQTERAVRGIQWGARSRSEDPDQAYGDGIKKSGFLERVFGQKGRYNQMSDIENRTQPSGVAYRTPGEAGHNGPADASAVAVVIVETDRFTRPGNFERWVALIETKGQDLANRTGAPVYIRYYNQSRGKGENGHVVFTPD